VGVVVDAGGSMGVSVGMAVNVAADSPLPHALRIMTIPTKSIMDLGRTGFLQGKEWANYTR
jgi:hypothetical protein